MALPEGKKRTVVTLLAKDMSESADAIRTSSGFHTKAMGSTRRLMLLQSEGFHLIRSSVHIYVNCIFTVIVPSTSRIA